MSKKKVYLRVRLIESWDDGQVKVEAKECDGFSVHLHVKRKDLLIVTPNSNIVPWFPAKNAPLYNPKDVAFKSPAKKAKKQRSKK